MKKYFKNFFSRNREALGSRTAKIGTYSAVLTAIVLAILVAVNIFASALPSTLTQYDMSAVRLYSLTSATKSVVNNLTEDVDIYWITQAGEEDTVTEKILAVYDDMSDHITVTKKNPDVYPTFAEQYTDEDVSNNSLVVVSGDRYRYIAYDEIYEQDTSSYYYTGSVSTSFDGEGRITSAINYVTTEDLPKVYVVSGHGEADLSDTFTSALEDANIETEDLALLTVDEIPDDANCVLVNAPTSDISEEEATVLEDYVAGGGKLYVISGPQADVTLTNLNTVLASYGVTVNEGVVVESDRDHYISGAPYALIPEIESSDITDALTEESRSVIVPIASGLTVGTAPDGITVTELLTTSTDAFSKIAGYDMETYDKEDGDISGPFAIAVSVEDSASGGELIWVASDNMMQDEYNSYSSGSNSDFIMNGFSWMIGDTQTISIRSKSLDYTYLTISDTQANIIKIILIGFIPVLYLLYGIDEVVRRRKKA